MLLYLAFFWVLVFGKAASTSSTSTSGRPTFTTTVTGTSTASTSTPSTTESVTTSTSTPRPTSTTTRGPVEGDIRLVSRDNNPYAGRIEIYHNGEWGTVCDDKFDNDDAAVVCRQLGISPDGAIVGAPTDKFGPGTGPIWIDELQCQGSESRITTCPFNNWQSDCSHSEDIGVECRSEAPLTSSQSPPTGTTADLIDISYGLCLNTASMNIRLRGPAGLQSTGVVQLRNESTGEWTTVCDDNFEIADARVACSQLCYNTEFALASGTTFDTSSINETVAPVVYDCAGDEMSLEQCPSRAGNCGPTEMAVVACLACDDCDFQPSRPSPILQCENGGMTIKFRRSDDPNLDTSHLQVNGDGVSPCNPTKTQDATYVSISISFDECGTDRFVNSTHITYRNTIRYGPTYPMGAVIIANEHIIHAACEIPRSAIVHKPFQPITDVFNISEAGEFKAKIAFYNDWSFNTPVTQFPHQVPIGTYLLVGVELEEQDPDLKLVVPNCFTTPTNNRNHQTNFPLFTDKCPDDNSVRLFPLTNKVFGYCMKAFKFDKYDEVHIHCDAFVCTRDEDTDECDRSCFSGSASGRRKRSTTQHKLYHISSKVVVVYNNRDEEEIIESPVVVTLTPDSRTTERPETDREPTTVFPETTETETTTEEPVTDFVVPIWPETTDDPTTEIKTTTEEPVPAGTTSCPEPKVDVHVDVNVSLDEVDDAHVNSWNALTFIFTGLCSVWFVLQSL